MHTGGWVLLVLDEAMVATPDRDNLGWGRLVVDSCGILATVHSGVSTVRGTRRPPWGSRRARSSTPAATTPRLCWALTGHAVRLPLG